jgi:hypothetical protein
MVGIDEDEIEWAVGGQRRKQIEGTAEVQFNPVCKAGAGQYYSALS